MVSLPESITRSLDPTYKRVSGSLQQEQRTVRTTQTAREIESIQATADARVRPFREAQQAFYAAAQRHDELVDQVVAAHGQPSRRVVETRVGGDMQQRDLVGAGRVYSYGTTVPVTDPDILRAFIFRDLEYERHLAYARLLKVERATMPQDASMDDYAYWVLRALSTVSKAMMALNLAPAQGKAGTLGTLGLWARDHGAPIDERGQRFGWPLLPQLAAVNGQTPSGNGKWWQNRVGWSGLFWTMEGSAANLADTGYAVGFPQKTYYDPQGRRFSWREWNEQYPRAEVSPGFMSEEAIAGDGGAYIADVDAWRLHLAAMFGTAGSGAADRMQALNYASAWLDWLLSLGDAGSVLSSYFTGWLMREFNTDANSAFGPNMPITLYDFSKVADDLSIAVFSFVQQIIALVQLVISAVSADYGGALSSLTSFGMTAAELGSSGYTRANFRTFHNPFIRWFSVPELNLDASNPGTEKMVQRLLGTALPNYQNKLGIDLGLTQDEPARPPPPPSAPPPTDLYREGPPPLKANPTPWGTLALVGGGIVGGALLLRMLRR